MQAATTTTATVSLMIPLAAAAANVAGNFPPNLRQHMADQQALLPAAAASGDCAQ